MKLEDVKHDGEFFSATFKYDGEITPKSDTDKICEAIDTLRTEFRYGLTATLVIAGFIALMLMCSGCIQHTVHTTVIISDSVVSPEVTGVEGAKGL